MKSIALALSLLGATACTVAQADTHAAPAPGPTLSAQAQRGLAFAQQHCAACHALTANATSPNPESPPFPDIANRAGVTEATLAQFLRDSHNFPEAMNFEVEPDSIEDLAAYLMTLRKPGYHPSI